MPSKYLFVQLCARAEGFGEPGKIPTIRNNPMDLRHAPGMQHTPDAPDAIGSAPDEKTGWSWADRQAEIWASRGLTLGQAIDKQLGIARNAIGEVLGNPDNNAWEPYLDLVMQGLECAWAEERYGDWQGSATPMTSVLKVPAIPEVTT